MSELSVLEKRFKELSNIVLKTCDDLDAAGRGVSNYSPNGNSREMCLLGLNLFNIYIAISDGRFDDTEIKLANSIAGTEFGKDEYEIIVDKTELLKGGFVEQVPVIFRVFVDADNYEDKSKERCPLSLALYDLFATSGVYMMVVNEQINADEYERLMSYLRRLHEFIRWNLKFGYGNTMRPEQLVDKILREAEINIARHLEENGKETKDKEEPKKKSSKGEKESETTLVDLLEELNAMVGLDEVKYEVTSLMNLLRVKMLREKMGLEMPPVSMHLVFSGNPGTGKTTVARLLAQIYKKIGVLSGGQLIEVDRSGLVGGYVGQTALKVGEVVSRALGGVLFIDEAYALTPENTTNDYGAEAVDTLVKAMEDYRDDLIVIVAGYPELMEHFLASNPGLRSRFNKFIYFRDYTPEELAQIFLQFCKKHGYRASRKALDYVTHYFEEKCSGKEKNFANARDVRNLFEYGISRQANRVMLIADPTPNNLTLLKCADVSGETIDLGKQQYIAQKIMSDLSKEKRHGLEMAYMGLYMDELELSAGAEAVLYKNQISTIKDFLDYLDSGREVADLGEISEEAEAEILKALEELGFEK